MTKREEFCRQIATMKLARRRTKSQHQKADYDKAIRRMQKDLKTYDLLQRQAHEATQG